MNAKVSDLMVAQVMTASPRQSAGRAREVMQKHKVKSLPVVDKDGLLLGVITSTDLLDEKNDARPVREIMSKEVLTVPQYADPSTAARMMRNHRVHHVVVTHEKRVVGILSSYDLLRLVEQHRYVPRNPPKKVPNRKRRLRNEGVTEEDLPTL